MISNLVLKLDLIKKKIEQKTNSGDPIRLGSLNSESINLTVTTA